MNRKFLSSQAKNLQYPSFPWQHPTIHPTNSKTQVLAYAHYSDERFKREQLVYLGCPVSELEELSWDYSDRLYGWDFQKARSAEESAKIEGHKPRTAAWMEVFLSHFYDDAFELKAIATGFNLNSGYDYFVYGYKRKQPSP